MDNEDFEHQLLLEAKEKALKEQKSEKDNPYLTRDPNDGTLYEYDPDKKAWFPKIDETFLAYYQQYNYQYVEPERTEKEEEDKSKKKESKKSDKKKSTKQQQPQPSQSSSEDQSTEQEKPKQPEWFNIDEERNNKVYISNLPEDVTEEEFVELMQKCGLILKDTETNKYKIKLYRDADGRLKGDGLCTYIKNESVILALQILDGYLFKGKEIKVERAKFELKGQYDPSKKPRKRKPEDKKKYKQKIQRLFSWQPDKLPDERSKREKIVILKNFFDPEEFDKDPTLIVDYKQDIEAECNEKCGPVKKVEIYDRNPEGVVAVFFKEFEHADKCVDLMNGRFFDGRQLSAENWDGKTKYKVKETEEEEKRRIEEWNKYLEEED